MPRDIQIVDTCDVCFDEGNEHVPAHETNPISIGAVKPRTMLLCEQHEKEYVLRLRDLLMEHGEISRGRKKATSTADPALPLVEGKLLDCPVKACTYANESRVNVGTHVRHVHGTTLAQFETETGHTIDGQPLKVHCPDCGLGYPHGAGMSAHRRTEHNYDPRTIPVDKPEPEDLTFELGEQPAPKQPPKKTAQKATRKRRTNLGV